MSYNAGNLRPVGKTKGFQTFATPQEGAEAMRRDLLAKVLGNSPAMKSKLGDSYTPTLRNLLNVYAPPSENDTDNYVNFVSSRSGINPDAPLGAQDVNKFMPHMITMEKGAKEAQKYKQYAGSGQIMNDASPEDFSGMSDEELMKIAGESPSVDFSQMSDEELIKIAGEQPDRTRTLAESDAMIAAQNKAAPWYERLGTGVKMGMGRSVLGMAELGQNIMEAAGAPRDQRYRELLAGAQKEADVQDKGTGAVGFLGNVAADPLTLLPVGKVATAGKAVLGVGRKAGLKTAIKESAKLGAKTGALAGAMQGTQDANSDIINNALNSVGGAALGGVLGAGVAPITHYGAKAIRSITKAGRQGLVDDAVEMADDAAKPLYDDYSSVLKGIGEVESVAGAKFNNYEAAADNLPNITGKNLSSVLDSLKLWAAELSDDISATPQQKTAMKRIIGQIEDGSELSVRDIIQLEKFANNRYGKYELGSVEARNDAITKDRISSVLDDVIPEGSKVKTLRDDAKSFFRNEVVPLRDKTLKKFGLNVDKVKQDQYDLRAFEAGELNKLPIGYKERAKELPQKIGGDLEAYREIAPLVSPDRLESFNKNVSNNSGAVSSRAFAPIRAGLLGAWGLGTMNKSMIGRSGVEAIGTITGRDPIHNLIKQGVESNAGRLAMQKDIAKVIGRTISGESNDIKAKKLAEAVAAQAKEDARLLNPAAKAADLQRQLLSPAGQAAYMQPNAPAFTAKLRQEALMKQAGMRDAEILAQEAQAAQAKKIAEEVMMQEQIAKANQITAGQAAERAAALRDIEVTTGRGRANNAIEEQLINALKNQKREPMKITIRPSDKRI